MLLYVSRGENTWYQEAAVTPDKDNFAYFAKEDGIYWFKMVIEDLKGNRDPADLIAVEHDGNHDARVAIILRLSGVAANQRQDQAEDHQAP